MSNVNKRVSLILYRNLLRTSQNFDKNPSAKALIFRTSISTEIDGKDSATKYYNQLISSLFHDNHSSFIHPEIGGKENSFTNLVKQEFRKNTQVDIRDRIDASFAILRKFSLLFRVYDDQRIDDDNNKYDYLEESSQQIQKMVDIENEAIQNLTAVPSKELLAGSILLSHPLLPGASNRSVVLLLKHADKFTYGIIVNKPTNLNLKEAVPNLQESIIKIFSKLKTFFGGRHKRLQMIHPFEDIGGNLIPRSSKPMYSSADYSKLLDFANKLNDSDIEKFHFFAGCLKWNSNELHEEIKAGYWIPVECAPDKVLELTQLLAKTSHQIRELETDNSGKEDDDEDLAQASILEGRHNEHRNLWNILLEKLGPSYSHLATVPLSSDVCTVESVDWK